MKLNRILILTIVTGVSAPAFAQDSSAITDVRNTARNAEAAAAEASAVAGKKKDAQREAAGLTARSKALIREVNKDGVPKGASLLMNKYWNQRKEVYSKQKEVNQQIKAYDKEIMKLQAEVAALNGSATDRMVQVALEIASLTAASSAKGVSEEIRGNNQRAVLILGQEIASLQEAMQKMNADLAAAGIDQSSAIGQQKAQINQLEKLVTGLGSLQTTVANQTKAFEVQEAKDAETIKQKTEAIAKLEEANRGLEADLASVKSKLQEAQTCLAQMEAENAFLNAELTQTQDALSEAEKTVNDQKGLLANYSEQIGQLTTNLNTATKKLADAEPYVNAAKALLSAPKSEPGAIFGNYWKNETPEATAAPIFESYLNRAKTNAPMPTITTNTVSAPTVGDSRIMRQMRAVGSRTMP